MRPKVTLSNSDVRITLCGENLLPLLRGDSTTEATPEPEQPIVLHKAIRLAAVNNGSKVVIGGKASTANAYLLKAIARAHLWNRQLLSGEVQNMTEIARRENIESQTYVRKVMNLQFLAPDITEAILAGNATGHITFDQLAKASRLHDWPAQRKALQF